MNCRFLKNSLLWGAVACVAIGCSDNDTLGGDDNAFRCQGRLGVDGVASASVVSRAEGVDLAALCGLTVPAPSELRLTLTGNDIAELESGETGPVEVGRFDYEQQWPTLADYDEPALYPGTYTALLEYGEPEAIGPKKPYYRGEATVTVGIGKETHCSVSVKIVNSAVRITADDNFKNYFSEPQFQLYLNDSKEPLKDDKQEIVFKLADTDAPIFMPAGTKVVVKGTVCRPSQGTDKDGNPLPPKELTIEVPVRTTAAGTLHTFRFAAEAGGANVEVEFGPFVEGSSPDPVELNDDAIKDEPAPDEPAPDESAPDEPAPDENTPDSGGSDTPAPDSGAQNGGASDENTPAE